jgi:KDO2-lipid IV(A) lauroyltransferase
MYYLVYGILYIISLLPLRGLYLIADLLYLLAYYVIGYRKKVVMENLDRAFPEKTRAEKIRIAKRFYKNLIDSFIETLKLLSAGGRFIDKHFTGNWEFLNELYKTGKSCQILVGHTFNWEWGNYALARHVRYKFLAVYMPLSNKVFERLFLTLRQKSGAVMLPATTMKNSMIPHRGTQYALGLVADQSPGNPAKGYWIRFFGQKTAFIPGPEKGARAGNIPIVFARLEKKRRGYYHAVFSMGEENPAHTREGEITIKYARYMESTIRQFPDMWLWSHKRWKHAFQPSYPLNFL